MGALTKHPITPARITLYHAKVCCGHSDFPMLLISCRCVQECFGSFWEVATDAAGDDAEKHTFGRSTTQLRNSLYEFRSCVVSKRTPVDREDAIDSLSQMMATKGSVYVVLGGKNFGKTLLKETAIKRRGANLAMLEVDMKMQICWGKV